MTERATKGRGRSSTSRLPWPGSAPWRRAPRGRLVAPNPVRDPAGRVRGMQPGRRSPEGKSLARRWILGIVGATKPANPLEIAPVPRWGTWSDPGNLYHRVDQRTEIHHGRLARAHLRLHRAVRPVRPKGIVEQARQALEDHRVDRGLDRRGTMGPPLPVPEAHPHPFNGWLKRAHSLPGAPAASAVTQETGRLVRGPNAPVRAPRARQSHGEATARPRRDPGRGKLEGTSGYGGRR